MQLIKQEHNRSVYADGNSIVKRIQLTEPVEQAQLEQRMNRINQLYQVDLFESGTVYTDCVLVRMKRLQNELVYDLHDPDQLSKTLEFFVETALQMFPYAETDVSLGNVMLHEDEWVMIDWDDTLLGHVNTVEYTLAELIKECCIYNADPINQYIKTVRRAVRGTPMHVEDAFYQTVRQIIKQHADDLYNLNMHKYFSEEL